MKKTKVILFLLVAFTTVFSLFSCKTGENGGGTVNENCVWGAGVAPSIIIDCDLTENLDTELWLNEFYRLTGSHARVVGEDMAKSSHEITVGRVDRELSRKAYTRLERILEDAETADPTGWLIYSDGTSLAIAYDGALAFMAAIDYFNENLLIKESLAPASEMVASAVFNPDEYVDNAREERRERELNALVPEIGEDAVAAFKKLFALYTDGLYKWMVDLYDPEIGGFYFCNSGRDTEGYLPDIQNTAQILGFLEKEGFIEGYDNLREAVPEEIGEMILAYAQGLQDPEDGYFYHPQWGKDIAASRIGRDLDWAVQVMQKFGGRPLYDTPNGHKGTLGAPGQNAPASYLTGRLSESAVVAVSRVQGVSKDSLPDYLKSLEAWDAYLKGLNIPYNSYNAGNTLTSQSSQIKFAGEEYVDHLINYINSIQNPDTALWEAEDSENDEYYALNGLMKLSSMYNAFQKPFQNPEAAVASCMRIILKPDGDTYMCSIYNPWITLYYVILSGNRTGGEAEVARLRALILPNARELIEATFKKIADYRMPDGAFATYGAEGQPLHLSQFVPSGCASKAESDVDASSIAASGVVGNIFNVLGCTKVPLYGKEDYVIFKERWQSLGTIIKKPYLNTIVPATFNEYDPEYATVDQGVVIDPDDNVKNVLGDLDAVGNKYKWFSSDVVSDPDPSEEGDLALRAETFLDNGALKDKATAMSVTGFDLQGVVQNENCFVFDSDIYFERTEGSMCIAEIYFATSSVKGDNVLGVIVTKYTANGKTYLSIGEAYEGLDGKKDSKIVSGIPMGEWIRLRLELYRMENDGELDFKCKVYVNGKYEGTCDSGYVKNGKYADRKVGALKYAHYRHAATSVYFDNSSLYAITKEYVKEEDYGNQTEGPQKIDFEDFMTYGDTTYIHAIAPVSPGAGFGVANVTGADGEDTRAYVYDSNMGGQDTFRLQSYGIDTDANLKSANAFTYDADMKLEFDPASQNNNIIFRLGSTSTETYHAYNLLVSLDANSGTIALTDVGVRYKGRTVVTDVENGEWFNVKIRYYYAWENEMLVLIYINDKLVYVSNNYCYENSNGSAAWPVFAADKYTLPNGKQIGGVEKMMFIIPSNTDATIYLDNCIIRRVELEVPSVNDGDYTSRFDEDMSGYGGEAPGEGENPGTTPPSGGTETPGGDDIPGGTTPPPTDGDVGGNTPDGTWKD